MKQKGDSKRIMATKKQTEHWYVLVLTDGGPAFITSVDFSSKSAEWNKEEAPYELSEGWAKDMTLGLNWNGYLSYPVCSPWEIDKQPYRYEMGQFEWKGKKENESDRCSPQ